MLSRILVADFDLVDDEDTDEDADALNDPLYQVDLQVSFTVQPSVYRKICERSTATLAKSNDIRNDVMIYLLFVVVRIKVRFR